MHLAVDELQLLGRHIEVATGDFQDSLLQLLRPGVNGVARHNSAPAGECATSEGQKVSVAVVDGDVFDGNTQAVGAYLGHDCFVALS